MNFQNITNKQQNLTEEEQVVSSSIDVDSIDVELKDIECPTHGTVMTKMFKCSDRWYGGACPACLEERNAKQKMHEEFYLMQQKKEALTKRIEESGVPIRYRDKNLNDFIPPNERAQKILDVAKSYVEKFTELKKKGTSLILCGSCGSGKTHIACSILNHVIKNDLGYGMFTTTIKAIRFVKESYSKECNDTEQERINKFRDIDLLVLDEVGVQFRTKTEENILFEIINDRYGARKPTILISNLSLKEMQAYVGVGVIDRLRDLDGRVLVFDWQSYRG